MHEVTHTAAALAAAYNIGDKEATAAMNLFQHTPRIVADTLFDLSRLGLDVIMLMS